ncbi:response regulator transcription factor [Vibrio sp. SCSIO 43137]|uniref:response regulator transcription factor n=1 Tax=Vibrio sp. SCSIO 43137 TaxID=3021011 RepID=UPI002307A90E|nr:response regulator transcription factor [Vibrio sp. SCSIO 43137]WCE31420.1 response regulator transcription factor [Vibrio sp. SCSIO 43137]
MVKAKILIIEDDRVIARLIKLYLDAEGYQVEMIFTGENAISVIREFNPDVVILDLMLPGKDGVDICREARDFFRGMILVLTASVDEMSEVSLFKFGADDYVTKPVKGNILLARVEALLRRAPATSTAELSSTGFLVEKESQRVFYRSEEIRLTPSEFDVFNLLFENFAKVVSREEFCKAVRGFEYNASDRTVDMRVSGLRKKLVENNVNEVLIKTLRNKGYMLVHK